MARAKTWTDEQVHDELHNIVNNLINGRCCPPPPWWGDLPRPPRDYLRWLGRRGGGGERDAEERACRDMEKRFGIDLREFRERQDVGTPAGRGTGAADGE